jgi:hypothetical protein
MSALPPDFTVKVVGVTKQDGYPDNILSLQEGQKITLVRNPDNEYDSNAIEVHCGVYNRLGHIPAKPPAPGKPGLAARLAPLLDAGERWGACVDAVLISDANPDQPGLSIRCWRVGSRAPNPVDMYPNEYIDDLGDASEAR